MTARTINDIAALIREVDPDNRKNPAALGAVLASRLVAFYGDLYAADIIAFVARTNPDKQMGAGALAELIVAEFNMDQEN